MGILIEFNLHLIDLSSHPLNSWTLPVRDLAQFLQFHHNFSGNLIQKRKLQTCYTKEYLSFVGKLMLKSLSKCYIFQDNIVLYSVDPLRPIHLKEFFYSLDHLQSNCQSKIHNTHKTYWSHFKCHYLSLDWYYYMIYNKRAYFIAYFGLLNIFKNLSNPYRTKILHFVNIIILTIANLL